MACASPRSSVNAGIVGARKPEHKRLARKPKPPIGDAIRAQNVLLEELRSQMQFVLETVTGHYAELKRTIQEVEISISQRIERLEQVVRKNSEDIIVLRDEVAKLRHDFDHREESKRTRGLEERVRRIEEKLGMTL